MIHATVLDVGVRDWESARLALWQSSWDFLHTFEGSSIPQSRSSNWIAVKPSVGTVTIQQADHSWCSTSYRLSSTPFRVRGRNTAAATKAGSAIRSW